MKNTIASRLRVSHGIAVLGLLALPSLAHAELLSSWTQSTGTGATNLNTASPILGNGSADSGDGQQIYATATSHTLTSVGDSIALTGSVTFSGLVNAGSDQFRFGIYDANGQSGTTGWLGYFATNSGIGANPNGRLWERDAANTTGFGSNGTGSATQIKAVSGTPSNTFASGTYTLSLVATRTATGLDLAWGIVGTDVTYSLSSTFADTTAQTFTFDRVGIFTGGGLNASQVSFSNLDLTYTSAIPEPASFALALGAAACMMTVCRRRQRAV